MKQHFSTRRFVWRVTAYPKAREGVVTLQEIDPAPRIPSGKPYDGERAEREARRRASTKCRRLCVANGLDRLWTLTYAVAPEDERQVVADVARFMRKMRDRFPNWRYLYVIERGTENGRLHCHFATNAFVPKSCVAAAWTHGFVDARRLTRGRSGDPRAAARYLSKYVSKPQSDEHRRRSGRRFVPGLGLRLDTATCDCDNRYVAERALSLYMGGGTPNFVWHSEQSDDWRGPPCTVAFWPA